MRDENKIWKKKLKATTYIIRVFYFNFVLSIQPFPNHEKKKKFEDQNKIFKDVLLQSTI
jgi:hypothetical protein